MRKSLLLRLVQAFWVLLLIGGPLYLVVSFNWWRFCRTRNDKDARKFILYGVAGIIGILGMATSWFFRQPVNVIITMGSFIPYVAGCLLQQKAIFLKKMSLPIRTIGPNS